MKLKTVRSFAIAAAVAFGMLGFASTASASSFCVPGFFAACPDNGTNQVLNTVQDGLNTSGADGQPDSVMIAPGTYSQLTAFTSSGTDPLTVTGAGRNQTVLTSTSTANGVYVVNVFAANRDITMRDLAIVVPASFPNSGATGAALSQRNDTFERVDFITKNDDSSGVTSATYGGTFRDVSFTGRAGGHFAYALGTTTTSNFCSSQPLQLLIEDIVIEDAQAGIFSDCPTIEVVVRNARITGTDNAILNGDGSTMSIENVLIESGDGVPVQAINIEEEGDTVLNVNHLTVIADADPTRPGILAKVYDVGNTDDVQVTLRNSVISGFVNSWSLEAPSGLGKGNVSMNVEYSNYPNSGLDTGDSQMTAGAGNSDAAPGFVGSGDYSPRANSALIDAGSATDTSPVSDLEGNLRPVDGNGDDIPVRDIGAFEFQPDCTLVGGVCQPTCEEDPSLCPPPIDKVAPKLTKVKFGFKSGKGGNLSFRVSEAATVRITLKPTPAGKGKKKRKTVKLTRKPAKASLVKIKLGKTKLRPGKYRLTILATDKSGNKSKPVTRKVQARR